MAIREFDRALSASSNLAEAYYYRGVAYYQKGDRNRAITDWEAVLRIDPNYPDIRRNIETVR